MIVLLLMINVVLCNVTLVLSQWDFAVTTKNRIIFYDGNWSTVATAAHQFEDLSAITFDESEERIYFNDLSHNNGSIFSIKLSLDDNHVTERHLLKTQKEVLAGMTFDPLHRVLYWTDSRNKKIYYLSMRDKKSIPEILLDCGTENCIPDGIAIDICRRKLYWTNSNHMNPTIESSALDGTDRRVLVNSSLFLPHGIVVDQFSSRIYWVVDQQGSHFSVESANLDGTNRRIVVSGLNNVPFSLATTHNKLYWTDLTHSAVWSVYKNDSFNSLPFKVKVFPTNPKGIVARTNFLTTMKNTEVCRDVVEKIKLKIFESMKVENVPPTHRQYSYCLNNGEYNPSSDSCICNVGFTGSHCEIDVCHNYCVNGDCNLSSMGFPECTCQEGFTGRRCEIYKCHDFCLNEGNCEILNDVPVCHCTEIYSGTRCDKNITEICLPHCILKRIQQIKHLPVFCEDSCLNYEELSKISSSLHSQESVITCNNTYNKTLIFGVSGILIGLVLILLILQTLKRFYKPARPKIKKTFVVKKKMSQTPLTSRPVATEQCEITIENCCNMNICDTPCFDPKLLQQNLSYESSKEDKKTLINNMEEDLY